MEEGMEEGLDMQFHLNRVFRGRRLRSLASGGVLFVAAVLITTAASPVRAQLQPGAPTDNFTMEGWVTGLPNPTDVAFLADGRAVITLKGGEVVVRRVDGSLLRNAAILNVDTNNPEKGLLGVVARISWRAQSDGAEAQRTVFLFASTGNSTNDKNQVFRAIVQADDSVVIDQTPLVAMGLRGPANHNGGGLQIHNDQLYISVGDSGANANPPTNKFASCLNRANGGILRVNLDGSIPSDNPLVGMAMTTGCDEPTSNFAMRPPDTRLYVWGLRNPWRFWVDPMTDLLWVGDVGQSTREEISIGGKGDHFGYPFEEGTTKFNRPGDPFPSFSCADLIPGAPCKPPVYDYARVRSDDNCVIGGLIPNEDGRLCGWSDVFKSRYFFGDNGSGRVWTLTVTANRQGVDPASVQQFATASGLSGFRMGHDDALYLIRHDANTITKLEPQSRDPEACAIEAMNTGGVDGNMGGQGGIAGPSGGTTGKQGGLPRGHTGGLGGGGASGDGNGGGAEGTPNGNGAGSSGCGCGVAGPIPLGSGWLCVLFTAFWLKRRGRRA